MAYTKTTWTNRVVEFPRRYIDELSNTKTFTPSEGVITSAGTTLTAGVMNNIETAIDDLQNVRNSSLLSVATAQLTNSNLGTLTGVYYGVSSDPNKPSGCTDGSITVMAYSSLYINQLYSDWRTKQTYMRNCNNGTWGAWTKILNQLDQDLRTDIKGTIQNFTVVGGNVTQILHQIGGTTVRTDTFTYTTNLITEVRTLSTGQTLTYKYHTDTLQTEVI